MPRNPNRPGGNCSPSKSRFPEEAPLTEVDQILLNVLNQKLTVRADGKAVEMTHAEILIKKQVESALKGSSHAMGQVMRQFADAQAKQEHALEEKIDFARKWKKLQQHRLDTAIAKGRSTDDILPHPDDIVVDRKKGYRVTGPRNAEEQKFLKEKIDARDVFLLQSELESRCEYPTPKTDFQFEFQGTGEGGTALFYAMTTNASLPKRFQWEKRQLDLLIFNMCCATKRELLKHTHQAWRNIGKPKPRGWLTPPYCLGVQRHLELDRHLETLYDDLLPFVGKNSLHSITRILADYWRSYWKRLDSMGLGYGASPWEEGENHMIEWVWKKR